MKYSFFVSYYYLYLLRTMAKIKAALLESAFVAPSVCSIIYFFLILSELSSALFQNFPTSRIVKLCESIVVTYLGTCVLG